MTVFGDYPERITQAIKWLSRLPYFRTWTKSY